jgi:hypothetical protein
MRPEIINSLTQHVNNETQITSVTKIDGGFTGAEKYRISGEPNDVFLKVADLVAFPNEAVALDNEASSYGSIAQLPVVQKYFPKRLDYANKVSTHSTGLPAYDYLKNASIGPTATLLIPVD